MERFVQGFMAWFKPDRIKFVDIAEARDLILKSFPGICNSTASYFGQYFSNNKKYKYKPSVHHGFEKVLLHVMGVVARALTFGNLEKFVLLVPDPNDEFPFGLLIVDYKIHLFFREDGFRYFVENNGRAFSDCLIDIRDYYDICVLGEHTTITTHVFSVRSPDGPWEIDTIADLGLPGNWESLVYQWDSGGGLWFRSVKRKHILGGSELGNHALSVDMYGPPVDLSRIREILSGVNNHLGRFSKFISVLDMGDGYESTSFPWNRDEAQYTRVMHEKLRGKRFGSLPPLPQPVASEVAEDRAEKTNVSPASDSSRKTEPSLLIRTLLAPIEKWQERVETK